MSAQLTAEYGQGFGERNLSRMIRFAEVFPDGRLSRRCRDNWAGATSSRSSR